MLLKTKEGKFNKVLKRTQNEATLRLKCTA